MAIKLQVNKQIPHVHIESDNAAAFNILVDQDEDILEEEGLTLAVQQINILYAELYRVYEW